MGILMSHHGKDQHGKGEHEVAELSIQVSILGVGGRKVTRSGEASQNGFPLDLAGGATYVFDRVLRNRSGRNYPLTEVAVPRIKSAAKRMRQARVRAATNRTQRSQLRTALRKVRAATGAEAQAAYADAVKLLDRAGKKSIIHKNAAARQKSRLAKVVAGKKG
jgi:small subunit ribosomal protein S20